MRLTVVLCISFVLIVEFRFSVSGQTVIHDRFPGIICSSEVETNQPQRLFIARIDLTNPRLRLRVSRGGPAPERSGEWETTLMKPTVIADREHFSLVVNGDFFLAKNVQDAEGAKSGYRTGQWGRPEGPAMTDGQAWSGSSKPRPCLVVHKDRTISIESLTKPAADDWEVVGGGPILLRNGSLAARPANPTTHDNYQPRHPRTAAGLDATGKTLILLVVDGRKPGIANGMTFNELATEMLRLGCRNAINLDGGGSSVMAVRDTGTGAMKILNEPTDGHERAVADVLGIVVDK
ncbi:MAG TPA: phosphodiester glycosidase family protein [Verrucomicrobiae bacterium]|jgi:exopolysaccharide biosynthesis protein|nr:phosphodiester glycosidase family protein [Verrucomicrobiae bacterium]